MRTLKFAVAALALACPSFAVAQEAALAGAATGALTGLVIGGPLGAVVGGAAGAVVGGAAQASMRANGTFQAPSARPVITERTCVEDAAGNQTCHEATR